jgi:hypothetical protein
MSQMNQPMYSPQQAEYPPQAQIKRKSVVLVGLLELLLPGAGFLYAGARWSKALLMFGIAAALGIIIVVLQQQTTLTSLLSIVSLGFFIYRVWTVRSFVKKRNSGLA